MFHSYVSSLTIFTSQCTPLGSAEQPWTATQKGWLHYLGVREQIKFPFVFWHIFMFV